MTDFEKQVKKALIDKDMTMTDLSRALGISLSYVSELIRGRRENQTQLCKIKDFLSLSENPLDNKSPSKSADRNSTAKASMIAD